jgi:hypothetical protein
LEHLQDCPACARLAEAAQLLGQAIVVAGKEDKLDLPSLAVLKARVNSQRELAGRGVARETSIMTALKKQLRKRSRLGIGISVAAAVLAFLTLVPFTIEQTVGYEVAVAGVDENLALDSDKLTEFLTQLGVGDACFDVTDCNKVCNVKISELKSPDDAAIVLAAFDEFDNVEVLKDICETVSSANVSVLQMARKNIQHNIQYQVNSEVIGISHDEAHDIVIERLGEDFTCDYILFKPNDSACFIVDRGQCDSIVAAANCSVSTVMCLSDSAGVAHASMRCGPVGAKCCDSVIVMTGCMPGCPPAPGGGACAILREAGIDPATFTGELDEETRRLLAEKGIKLDVDYGLNGERRIKVTMIDSDEEHQHEMAEFGQDPTAKEAGEILPKDFSLSQNYPNPFNAATTIEYLVGKHEHVTIDIINVTGQTVRRLVDKDVGPGTYSVEWDGTNDAAQGVASGVYYYRLTAGDYSQTKSMTLLK